MIINLKHTISNTRTRTLIIIVSIMLIISAAVAFYSFSKGNKKNIAQSETAGIPKNIYITPGAKSSEKYVELQEQANLIGTKQAAAKGKTFIPTIIGNKSEDNPNSFNDQIAGLLGDKLNSEEYEKLSKIIASLLNQMNEQGQMIDNLLRLLKELQNQGFNIEDLEQLLKTLMAKGYNTDELAKLLKMLKEQGYSINDLEKMLRRLLAEGYDPNLINELLEQLLRDRLKRLQDQGLNSKELNDLLKALMAKGYNLDELEKLLQALKQQGLSLDDLEQRLQQLLNQQYDPNAIKAMLEQLLNERLKKLKNQAGLSDKDLDELLKALMAKGYNPDELQKLLQALKQQGLSLDDLEKRLQQLLNQQYDPNAIKAMLEQLLNERLKKLKDDLKKLEDAGFKIKQVYALNQQLNNPAFDELLQQLANQGYKMNSLEDLLKELMNKGYNVFKMPIMLKQLQQDGYDISKLQALIDKMKAQGQDINDIRDLIAALANKNVNQTPKPEPAKLAQSSDPLNKYKEQLSNLFDSNKENNQDPSTSGAQFVEDQYEAFLKQQQERELADQRARELAEQEHQRMQKMLMNSEATQKELEAILTNMSKQASNIISESGKIPSQNFVQGAQDPQKQQPSSTQQSPNPPSGDKSSANQQPDKVLKAGTVLFAVLQTSVNSDQPGPILAKIVQPPLNNTTIIGSMQKSTNRYAEGLLISFSKASIPNRNRSYGLSAIAIDPDTAKTVIASDINHHYLLRWGSLFAATFLKGYSKAIAESNTTVTSSTNGSQTNTVTEKNPLKSKQQIFEGIGEVASAVGQNISGLINRPATIKINSGTSIALLLTNDFTIPKETDSNSKQPNDNPVLISNNTPLEGYEETKPAAAEQQPAETLEQPN